MRPERFRNDGIYYLTMAGSQWSEPRRAVTDAAMTSLVVRDGNLHLAYDGVAQDGIYYATNSSGEWQSRRVAAAGWSPTMKVDPEGWAVFAFVTDSGLAHTSGNVDAGFGFAGMPKIPCSGEVISMALDHQGRARIVAGQEETADWASIVVCTERDNGAWTGPDQIGRHEVPQGIESWLWIAPTGAVVDERGSLHVIYWVTSEETDEDEDYWALWEDIWYASNDGGSFQGRQLNRGVAAELGPGGSAALALDRSGRPQILFTAMSLDDEDDLFGLWYAVGPAR